MFLNKWENVESNKGKPVLSEEAVQEVRKIQEHMRKGCCRVSCPLTRKKLLNLHQVTIKVSSAESYPARRVSFDPPPRVLKVRAISAKIKLLKILIAR